MCIDATTQADLDVWADRFSYGGGMDFVLWAYQKYRMFGDEWGNAGYFDALNQNLPFAKVMNAAWLIEWGLSDNHDQQWHGSIDYKRAARGRASRTHNQIHYDFGGANGDAVARAHTHQITEDSTELFCGLFERGTWWNHPIRASALIHEGWHHWAAKYDRDTSHLDGPIGACTESGAACDWYYFHGIGEFEFGDMWQYRIEPDGTSHRFHKPYQAEVEYLCDLAEYPEWWVPASVTLTARAAANHMLLHNFRNPVGYSCGEPRPW